MDSRPSTHMNDADLDIVRAALGHAVTKSTGHSGNVTSAAHAARTTQALEALERIAVRARLDAQSLALGQHVRSLIRRRAPDSPADKPVFSCSFTMLQAAGNSDEAIAQQIGEPR
jgi:hypothetical protein